MVLPLQQPRSQYLFLKVGTLPLGREMPGEQDYFWRVLFSYACAVKYINLYIIYGIQDILYRKSLKIKNLTLSIVVV